MCKNGEHSFEVVMKKAGWNSSNYSLHVGHNDYNDLVRWCKKCGSIHVDREHKDGRIDVGELMEPKNDANTEKGGFLF